MAVPDAVQAILSLHASSLDASRVRASPCQETASRSAASAGSRAAAAASATTSSYLRQLQVIAAASSYPREVSRVAPEPSPAVAPVAATTPPAVVTTVPGPSAPTGTHKIAFQTPNPYKGQPVGLLKGGTISVTAAAAAAAATPAAVPAPPPVGSSRAGGTYSVGLGRGVSSLKAPVGLSRCTIAEDAPFPPPNTQVVMELQEKTVRVGGRRLRYRGYRPTDRPLLPGEHIGPAGFSVAPGGGMGVTTAALWQHLASVQHGLPTQGPLMCSNAAAAASEVAAAAAAGRVINHQCNYHNHLYNQSNRQQPASYPPHLQHSLNHLPSLSGGAGGSHVRMSIKVPWAHPSDLQLCGLAGAASVAAAAGGGAFGGGSGGGLLESLNAALSSGSGYMVVGAAVRQGCILLQLHLLATKEVPGCCPPGTGGVGYTAMAVSVNDNGSSRGARKGCPADEYAVLLATRIGHCLASLLPRPPAGPSRQQTSLLSLPAAEQRPGHTHECGGGSMLVDIDGRLSYTVAFDADRSKWLATAVEPFDAPAPVELMQAVSLGNGPEAAHGGGDGIDGAGTAGMPVTVAAAPRSAVAGGPAFQLPWLRCLAVSGPNAVRFWTPRPVVLVSRPGAASAAPTAATPIAPREAVGYRAVAVAALGPRAPEVQDGMGGLALSFHVEFANAAAAELLAAELLALCSGIGPASEPTPSRLQPEQLRGQVGAPQAAPLEQCQLVATCLGRSLRVAVLTVSIANTRGRDRSGHDAGNDANAPGGGATDVPIGCSPDVPDGSCSDGIGGRGASDMAAKPAANAPPTVRVEVAVAGCPQALEAAGCRLAQLTLELWSGEWCVGQVPYMLIHDAADTPLSRRPLPPLPLPPAVTAAAGPAASGCSAPGSVAAAAAAQALVAELHELAAASAETDGDECVRQLFDDLSTLELCSAVQQCRDCGDSLGGDDAAGSGSGGVAVDDPSMLPGSLDLSLALRQHLASSLAAKAAVAEAAGDPEQCHRALTAIGANLLSYAVLHGLPFAASFAHECLAALGCGLAEADELTAAAAATAAVNIASAAGMAMMASQVDGWGLNGAEESDDGLPLLHLAVLSGDPRVVYSILHWAASEGLTADWAHRRHRGLSALEYATAALTQTAWRGVVDGAVTQLEIPDGNAGCGCGPMAAHPGAAPEGASQTAFLQHVECLIRAVLPDVMRPPPTPSLGSPYARRNSDMVISHFEAELGAERSPASEEPHVPPVAAAAATRPGHLSAAACGRVLVTESRGDESTARDSWVTAGNDKAATAVDAAATSVHCANGIPRPWSHPLPLCNSADSSLSINASTSGGKQRHPLLVCLLGYPDPHVEARFRNFDLRYEAQLVPYWALLMCALLVTALLRRFRSLSTLAGGVVGSGGTGAAGGMVGGGQDAVEARVSVVFAGPYVLLAMALWLRPSWVHRHMRAWWLLCGAARMSTKPLCAAGILPLPASMLTYTRNGVTLVTDTVLPALCERVNGLPGLVLRSFDTASHFYFLLCTGVANSPARAALYAGLRCALYLGCAVLVERYRRRRFEASSRAGAAVGAAGGGPRSGAASVAAAKGAALAAVANIRSPEAAAVPPAAAAGGPGATDGRKQVMAAAMLCYGGRGALPHRFSSHR